MQQNKLKQFECIQTSIKTEVRIPAFSTQERKTRIEMLIQVTKHAFYLKVWDPHSSLHSMTQIATRDEPANYHLLLCDYLDRY